MLRAAAIGLASSGKSTLFQLMTIARDGSGGKSDARIGAVQDGDIINFRRTR